jgi:hypothetical protein
MITIFTTELVPVFNRQSCNTGSNLSKDTFLRTIFIVVLNNLLFYLIVIPNRIDSTYSRVNLL